MPHLCILWAERSFGGGRQMSSTPPPRGEAQRSLLGEVIRLGHAYLEAGADFWGRGWEINARYAQQAISNVVSGQEAAQNSGDIVSTIISTYKHYAAELAMVPWLAAVRLDAELASVANRGAGQTFTSEEKSHTFTKDGK